MHAQARKTPTSNEIEHCNMNIRYACGSCSRSTRRGGWKYLDFLRAHSIDSLHIRRSIELVLLSQSVIAVIM